MQSYYKAKPCFSSIQDRAALILARWHKPQTAGLLPSVPQRSDHQLASGNHQCKQRSSGGAQAPLCLSLRIPQDITQRATQEHQTCVCIAFLNAQCVHAHICVRSCVFISGIFIWFSCSSERDRFTDGADLVQSTMLALSLFRSFCLVCSLTVAFLIRLLIALMWFRLACQPQRSV